jgi:hypothetical protein
MHVIRTLVFLGAAYWLYKKFGSERTPTDGLAWENARSTGVAPPAGARKSSRKSGVPSKSSAASHEERHGAQASDSDDGEQPFGENGNFGSHAPYGQDPNLH